MVAKRKKLAKRDAVMKEREAMRQLAEQPVDLYAAITAKRAAERARFAGMPDDNTPPMEGLDWDPPAEEVVGQSGKLYASTSLFCLRPYHCLRRLAIEVVESRPFDPIILFAILANCTTMAWESPLDPPHTWKAGFIDVRRRRLRSRCASACACVHGGARRSHARSCSRRCALEPPPQRSPGVTHASVGHTAATAAAVAVVRVRWRVPSSLTR